MDIVFALLLACLAGLIWTAPAMWLQKLASKRPPERLRWFVLGGWALKLLALMAFCLVIQDFEGYSRPAFGVALAVLGVSWLAFQTWAFLKSRKD